jgi:hypothetical protein
LNENGRIVNVSSKLGALKFHPEKVQKIFSNPNIDLEEI